jgi:Spy/CpxP family protein refolding chaperone
MRRLWQWALALVALAGLVSGLQAQEQPQRQAGAMRLGLLTQKSVQEELKLSDDQARKVEDYAAKQRKSFQGLRDLSQEERREKLAQIAKENEQLLKDTLKPEQAKRLREISLQLAGPAALHDPEVAKALNLTGEQKEKLRGIEEEARRERRELFQAGGDREERRKKAEELRKANREKVMNLLTPEQKEKWKELTGEPFKGEIRFGPPGGGRDEDDDRPAGKPKD